MLVLQFALCIQKTLNNILNFQYNKDKGGEAYTLTVSGYYNNIHTINTLSFYKLINMY